MNTIRYNFKPALCAGILIASLFFIFIGSCKKETKPFDQEQLQWLNYKGKDEFLIKIVNQLKQPVYSAKIVSSCSSCSLNWDNYLIAANVSDSLSYMLVPVKNAENIASEYLKVTLKKGRYVSKVAVYDYERDFLNNKDQYARALSGVDFKLIYGKKIALPNSFSPDTVSKLYRQQLNTAFSKETTQQVNITNGTVKKMAVAQRQMCSIEANIYYYIRADCAPMQEIIRGNYINSLTNLLIKITGSTDNFYVGFDGFGLRIGTYPEYAGPAEGAILMAFQNLPYSNCNISIQDYYVNTRCQLGDGGTGGGSSPAKVITDSVKKHFPCLVKLIIDSLDKIPNFSALVQPFTTSVKPDLIWQYGSLPWNASIPNSTATTYQLGSTSTSGRSATITLNTNMLQNSSQLLIAATAIHETLHAYINYLVETKLNFNPPALYDGNSSWLVSLDYWAYLSGLPTNYRDHYQMLNSYFDQAVGILKAWDNNGHTDKEYQEAMLYGLDTNDFVALSTNYPASLSEAFDAIKTRYNITDTELNTFKNNNINSVANKLPANGCN